MIIYNPSNERVVFYYDSKPHYFEAKESVTVTESLGKFILDRNRVGLVEYDPSYDKDMLTTDMEYAKMPWKELLTLASKRGIFKPGAKKSDVLLAMEEYDRQAGTSQKSSDQEEA